MSRVTTVTLALRSWPSFLVPPTWEVCALCPALRCRASYAGFTQTCSAFTASGHCDRSGFPIT